MATWTPTGTLPPLSEGDTNVKLTFSVSDDTTSSSSGGTDSTSTSTSTAVTYTIKSVDISPSSVSSFFTKTLSGNTATLFASSLSGAFPILNIRYMLNGAMYNTNSWDNVPSNASHITEYTKDPGSPKQITITISADGSDKSNVTNSWIYTFNGNYSLGIDKFLYELSIRK
jgi:hypothetical protein